MRTKGDQVPAFPRRLRSAVLGMLVAFCVAAAGTIKPAEAAAPGNTTPSEWLAIPGHMLPGLASAQVAGPYQGDKELVVTLVLRRDDAAGFESWLKTAYDPASPNYRKFSKPEALADRFGPSQSAYDDLTRYLEANGFEVIDSTHSRQTLTARGTREAARKAFSVRVDDYLKNGLGFYANASDPLLPAELAVHVEAIAGLASFAAPVPVTVDQALNLCGAVTLVFGVIPATMLIAYFIGLLCTAGQIAGDPYNPLNYCDFLKPPFLVAICAGIQIGGNPPGSGLPPHNPPFGGGGGGSTLVATGDSGAAHAPDRTTTNEQTVAIASFSGFNPADVTDWLALMGFDPAQAGLLTRVPVNGGATTTANETEVLLDIAAVWSIAPTAKIRVYEGPFSGPGSSFQALFSKMITDGVDIITNSFAYCENDTTLADVQSINSILQTAAAAGISVFSATGDAGSTCLNGSANTAHVPASSPNLTAVGGSRLSFGPGFTYGSETWWNGSSDVPPTGQGGFGVSAYFNRPSYQNGLTASPKRSLPDVVINADPATGYILCQANDGGCPTGKLYGGSSVAAPVWAGFAALLNEAQGTNLGFLNPLIYPHAASEAFHNPASMGSDFAHVGLGSPNLDVLYRLLNAIAEGLPDADRSEVNFAGSVLGGTQGFAVQGIPADGDSAAVVVVTLRDASGHTVSGRNVTLESDGATVDIEPAGPLLSDSNGQAAFELRNLTPENVTLTARDALSNMALTDKPIIPFTVPPAASAGIGAFPTTLNANGTSTTAITVTLLDGLGRPAPGKEVHLAQGSGHAVISGPEPPRTDNNGEIVFTATDLVNEVVTFKATVVSDIVLPVPGSAVVTFQNGLGGCGSETPPNGANGYTIEPFATGFATGPLFYGNINFGNCIGAAVPAFRDEQVFIANSRTGDIYTFGTAGGAAVTPLNNQGQTLAVEAVGKDGRLYARRVATTGDFTTGAILELDPATGDVLRTVASGLKCPYSLVVDPLSGDLFYDDYCFGPGSNDPAIHRVRNPGSLSPTVEVYTTLAKSPNGQMSFAPDGTLYVVSGYLDPQPAVVRVSGTDGPPTPTKDVLAGIYSFFWISVVGVGPDGEATTLAALQADGLKLFDLTQVPPVSTVIAQNVGSGVVGADGCLYPTLQHTVYRITDPDGGCSFAPGGFNPTVRLELSPASPAPVQGSTQQLIATAKNFDSPANVIINFLISGANQQIRQVRTEPDGTATLEYQGIFAGTDHISATAVLADESMIDSNPVEIDFSAGPHTSFLSLNQSATSGPPGEPATVTSTLVDISLEPPVAASGKSVHFQLGAANCTGITDAFGKASCDLTPAAAGGYTLIATFDGTAGLTPAEDSIGFSVFDPGAYDTEFKDGFESGF